MCTLSQDVMAKGALGTDLLGGGSKAEWGAGVITHDGGLAYPSDDTALAPAGTPSPVPSSAEASLPPVPHGTS